MFEIPDSVWSLETNSRGAIVSARPNVNNNQIENQMTQRDRCDLYTPVVSRS